MAIGIYTNHRCRPGSSVGIATGYGLDGPGIESRWGRHFLHLSRPALGLTQPPIQWVLGLPGSKAAGAWRWPPSPFSAEVNERVELYIFSPPGPLWPVLGWILPLPFKSGRLEVLWSQQPLVIRRKSIEMWLTTCFGSTCLSPGTRIFFKNWENPVYNSTVLLIRKTEILLF